MVSFLKIFACVGLFGEQTLIIEQFLGLLFTIGPLISIFWELGGKHV